MSHDDLNAVDAWRSIIVLPLSTSFRQSARTPLVVTVPRGVAWIESESSVLAHQVTVLDRSKLERRVGALPKNLMREVERALSTALGMV